MYPSLIETPLRPTELHGTESILADLETRGWSLVPDFLPAADVARLRKLALDLMNTDNFRPAAVGNRSAMTIDSKVRSDRIAWIDPCDSDYMQLLGERLESLRLDINRELLLGLMDIECHFAHYQPGAFYEKHVDRFRLDDRRRLTIVLYLNTEWQPDDGGELLLYEDQASAEAVRIRPDGGTLVTFLSDRFPHEVLPARRDRLSLAGWFRTRELSCRF